MRLLFPLVVLMSLHAAAVAMTPIRSFRELNSLSDADAAAQRPFELEGTVIFVEGFADRSEEPAFVISDGDVGAAFIELAKGVKTPPLGAIVRTRGQTSLDYSLQHIARANEIVVCGHGPLPTPEKLTPDQLLASDHDLRLVRVIGTITDAFKDEIDFRFNYVLVRHGAAVLPIAFQDTAVSEGDLQALVGAEVAAEGVCLSFAGERKYLGPRLSIRGLQSITVLKASPANPFAVPELEKTHHISPTEVAVMGKRRIDGLVVAVWDKNHVILQTASGNTLKLTLARNQPVPTCGDTITAAGFAETDLFRINLTEVRWQHTSVAAKLEMPTDAIDLESFLKKDFNARQMPSSYFGKNVTFCGIVRGKPDAGNPIKALLLECQNVLLPVFVDSVPDICDGIAPGSLLRVFGICLLDTENWRSDAPFPRTKGMAVIARTPADIKIISRPPWWTIRRLIVIISLLTAALVGIFIWNRMLKRIIVRYGKRLMREEIAHTCTNLKLEERTRLAVELHDTFAQNLAGVSLQIDAAQLAAEKDPSTVMPYLESSRQKMRSCLNNLRNCLWDLRSRPFEEKELGTAIHKTIVPHLENASTSVNCPVHCHGLSDNTIHAVLCIIRELVINAIRHGHASHIDIAGTRLGEHLTFSVRDNGCGFDPQGRPNMAEGHFGLQGVGERIHRLGGSWTIDSKPGQGCAIVISGIMANG